MDNVWVLTEEHNDYHQYGEYFLAVFKERPTVEKLMEFMSEEEAVHIQSGGGRMNTEDHWFNLKEEPLK